MQSSLVWATMLAHIHTHAITQTQGPHFGWALERALGRVQLAHCHFRCNPVHGETGAMDY